MFTHYRNRSNHFFGGSSTGSNGTARSFRGLERLSAERRSGLDTSGLNTVGAHVPRWTPDASLDEISAIWHVTSRRGVDEIDRLLAAGDQRENERIGLMLSKAALLNFAGDAREGLRGFDRIAVVPR